MRTLALISTALVTLSALGLLLSGGVAQAQTTMTGTILGVRTGWNNDSFAVVTVEPMPNPAGCRRSDGYVTDKSLPGYSTYLAAALTAYSVRRRVMLVAHDTECYGDGGWPKLIGINLTQD
jgi:hypothetical protein